MEVGGKERRLMELLRGLKSRGTMKCELVVLSDEIFYSSVSGLEVRIHRLKRRTKKDLSVLVKLYRICREFQPDIVHSWGSMCSVYAIPIVKALGIKFVNGMIADVPPKLKSLERENVRARLTFPFSDLIVANSYAGLKAFAAPEHRSHCIHNGFDFARVENLKDPDVIKRKYHINTPFVVGMVAVFTNRKDYQSFITAAEAIVRKRDDVTFLGIGDGDLLKKCREKITDAFQTRILLPGAQQDVESIVNVFDVGVLATNDEIHGEGISNAIMEYMALSKPVVATHGGGTGEIVVDNVTGFLVEPRQPAGLAERIEFLLEHKDEARSMGMAGKQRIVDEFSLEKMVDRYVEMYERLASSHMSKGVPEFEKAGLSEADKNILRKRSRA
jgi:glycosyltransferase involved in cell wall biosynthesis